MGNKGFGKGMGACELAYPHIDNPPAPGLSQGRNYANKSIQNMLERVIKGVADMTVLLEA